MNTILSIKAGQQIICEEEVKSKYATDACKEIMGEKITVQFVGLNKENTLFLAVDEDGFMKRLAPNFFIPYFDKTKEDLKVVEEQVIVGDVCICKCKPFLPYLDSYDRVLDKFTEEDINWIQYILSPEIQNQCREHFFK